VSLSTITHEASFSTVSGQSAKNKHTMLHGTFTVIAKTIEFGKLFQQQLTTLVSQSVFL